MSRAKAVAALALLASSAAAPVQAQSVRVSPVTLELRAGAVSSVLTLDSDSKEGVAVQARVFRWSQVNGEEKLEKTADVVVSPPGLMVRSGAPSQLRLIRIAKTPVSGEETYRVFIDEIPDRKKLQTGVALSIRQSLPVFFTGIDATPASINWKVGTRKGKPTLEAVNLGQKHVRFFSLLVADEANKEVLRGGPAYLLGGQSKTWELTGAAAGRTLSIKATGDTGPMTATAIAGRG